MQANAALATSPLTTTAAAISLSALAVAFAGNTPSLEVLIVVFGLFICATVKKQPAAVTVALSAISLAAYLQFSPVP